VHECETEFGVFPVSDVINIRKRKFLVKYDLSDITCHANCEKTLTKLFDILFQSSYSLVTFNSHVL